jgi:two-component system, chemotaxis family, chemotaxis protein CheY
MPPTAHPSARGQQDLADLTILTLDDDPTIRSIIRSALAQCGCRNILQAESGPQALRLFETQRVDLVLCDWMMEPMNGLEFVTELRKFDKAAAVPVIMVTANSEPADAMAARHLNIAAWMLKPIAIKQLTERVWSVLSLPAQSFSLERDLGVDLGALHERYRAKLSNELRELEHLVALLPQRDRQQIGDHLSSMLRLFHTVKGQAGTFGYDLITTLAGIGQNLLREASGDIQVIVTYQDRLHRVLSILAAAMSLVLRNDIKGSGGSAGDRLLNKLNEIVVPLRMLIGSELKDAKVR